MINVGKTHDIVRVVNDQIGTPTYTLYLAWLLIDMIETDKYGYYHATNEGGYISWADLDEEAYRAAGMDEKSDESHNRRVWIKQSSEIVQFQT